MCRPRRTDRRPPRRHRLGDERGIALLIVLVVVALLTITVTEFTYSVQIDQHRTRNAIHALQSQLLARSGINIMEGFLLLDNDGPPTNGVTWWGEDWWLQLNEFCKNLQIDESTLIRCRVRDESGKININNTRPPARPVQGQVTKDAVLRDAMRCFFERRGIEVDIVDQLLDYWQQEPPARSDGRLSQVPEFESLEDFAARFGIPTEQLVQLRPVLMARPTGARQLPINVNTAPAEVLAAVLNPENRCEPNDAVTQLMEKRASGDPLLRADIAQLPHDAEDRNWSSKSTMLGTDSSLYRLEASALSNIDPEHPESGGIGQTLSVLVERRRRGGVGLYIQGGPPIWTLRLLDWQKEAGARLFHETQTEEDELGSMDDETTDEQSPGT